MTTLLCTTTLTLSLLLPTSAPTNTSARGFTPDELATLQVCAAPNTPAAATLGALRAGTATTPRALGASERTKLAMAEQRSGELALLRGGSEPSNNEWRWLAIGAGLVLLIVLI